MQWSGALCGIAGFADLALVSHFPQEAEPPIAYPVRSCSDWASPVSPPVTEKPVQWQHHPCIGMVCAITTWMPLLAKGQEIQHNVGLKCVFLQSHLGKYPLPDGEPLCVPLFKYTLQEAEIFSFPFINCKILKNAFLASGSEPSQSTWTTLLTGQ